MKYLFPVIFCLFAKATLAQTDSTSHPFSVKIGVYYSSYLHYYGRTDSIKTTGAFPMAELWFRKKFYINTGPVFTINGTGTSYAGSVSTIGFLQVKKHSITHVYVVKPWYKSNSLLPQSALKAQVAAMFSNLGKIVSISAGADVKFSDKQDIGTSIGLDHSFRKITRKRFVLVADPTINLYAGTQRFTQSRYEKTNLPLLPPSGRTVYEEVSTFRILSIEASMPLILAKDHWMLMLTPSYVMPKNLLRVENGDGISENGVNTFYFSAGLKYTF